MLILLWVERRGSKPNNYTSTLWDFNCACAFKCLFNPKLSLPLLTNLQFRFPFAARAPLQELLNYAPCTKRIQKAQHSSPKTEVFCCFRGSGSWNYLQEWLNGIFRAGLHGWVQTGPSSFALTKPGSETLELWYCCGQFGLPSWEANRIVRLSNQSWLLANQPGAEAEWAHVCLHPPVEMGHRGYV